MKTDLFRSMSISLWPHGLYPTKLLCPWNSPGKNVGMGCHFLLQGIFPTQGLNPGQWQPTPVSLSGKSHGQSSLVGYSPRGRKESDTTERLHTHTHTHTPSLQADSLPTEPPGKSVNDIIWGLVLNRKINQVRIKNSVHSLHLIIIIWGREIGEVFPIDLGKPKSWASFHDHW